MKLQQSFANENIEPTLQTLCETKTLFLISDLYYRILSAIRLDTVGKTNILSYRSSYNHVICDQAHMVKPHPLGPKPFYCQTATEIYVKNGMPCMPAMFTSKFTFQIEHSSI